MHVAKHLGYGGEEIDMVPVLIQLGSWISDKLHKGMINAMLEKVKGRQETHSRGAHHSLWSEKPSEGSVWKEPRASEPLRTSHDKRRGEACGGEGRGCRVGLGEITEGLLRSLYLASGQTGAH